MSDARSASEIVKDAEKEIRSAAGKFVNEHDIGGKDSGNMAILEYLIEIIEDLYQVGNQLAEVEEDNLR